MQKVVSYINSVIPNCQISNSTIINVQACLGKEMKVDNWISLLLSDKACAVLKFDNEVFKNEGYMITDERILKVCGKDTVGFIPHGEESVEEGIVDLDHGSRFEGSVLKECNIPFGFGKMYDDDGLLVYKGIVINWKRFGYGVSYHNNGLVEYEGYWCDDKRFGRGKLYDRSGQLVKECDWWDGSECGTEYFGNGSQPINIGIKHLKLSNNCILKNWDVSWFDNLESIEIGDDCFESVQTFKIEELNKLKSLKVGYHSFTYNVTENNMSNSFQILNCELLGSIEIGDCSFINFSGKFELKNLPSLQTLGIGDFEGESFYRASFFLKGILFSNGD